MVSSSLSMCMKSDKHGPPYFFLMGRSKDTVCDHQNVFFSTTCLGVVLVACCGWPSSVWFGVSCVSDVVTVDVWSGQDRTAGRGEGDFDSYFMTRGSSAAMA